MPSGGWWLVITTVPSGDQLIPNYVQSKTVPSKNQKIGGNQVWGVFGPWPTKAAAQTAFQQQNFSSKQAQPTSDSPFSSKPGQSLSLAPGASSLPSLTRIAEIIIGIGLIIVAVAKIAGDTPIGRAATKVGKAAAIL